MKREKFLALFALAVTLAPLNVAMAAIDPDAKAVRWWSYSEDEQQAFAEKVATICSERGCDAYVIRKCIDTALEIPVPDNAKRITIGTVALGCFSMLNK